MLTRKDLISLVTILVLLIAIPVVITLLRQQQILKSKAATNAIVFTGPNVTTVTDASGSSRLIATDKKVQLQLTSTLDQLAPSPTATTNPTATATSNPTNNPTSNPTATPIPGPAVDNIRPHGYEVYPDSPSTSCQIIRTAQSGTNANISGSITGWACDPDDPSAQIGVDFHVDGQYAGTVTANSSLFNGPDLSGICGGTLNHGYTINLSSLSVNIADGNPHTVTAYGHNVYSNGTEISGPDQGAHKWDYNAQLKAISNGATQSSNQFSVTCGGASGPTQTPITTDTIQTSGSWSGSVPHEVGQYGRGNLSVSGGKTFQFNYDGSAHIYAVAINSSGNWDGGSVEKNTNISIPSGDYLQLITDTQNQAWSNLSLVQIQ